jgi:hypothetical protein
MLETTQAVRGRCRAPRNVDSQRRDAGPDHGHARGVLENETVDSLCIRRCGHECPGEGDREHKPPD